MTYLLGLDQGGTKTVAAIADKDGRIVGVGYSGGSCHSVHGMEHSMQVTREAIHRALAEAKVQMKDIDLLYAGMTGADFPYEYSLLQEALIQSTGIAHVTVVNDCLIGYRGGTSAPYGAVLCVGTGTNAAIIDPHGQAFVYGYHINDEDSGGEAIGKEALKLTFNAHVGLAPATILTSLILKYYQLNSIDELMIHDVQGKLGSKKHLAPIVFEAAAMQDAPVVKLLSEFGKRIARYIEVGCQRFGMTQLATDIVMSGSILKANPQIVQDTVVETLRQSIPNARFVNAKYEPVVGALLLAFDELNGNSYSLEAEPLARSADHFHLFRN